MSFDAKLWLQSNLNSMASNRALQEIERTGQALPCQITAVMGSIVTVSFEVQGGPWTLPPLTLPKAESQWLRAPTQVGDYGITVPADTYLGGISGYGGVADLTVDYGNMSCLVWVPVGSKVFSSMPDPNKVWVNGPNGAVVSDSAQQNTIVVDLDPSITSTVNAAEGAGATYIQSQLDGVNNAITHFLTSTEGPLASKMDGLNNLIQHYVTAGEGQVLSKLDGVNNAITHELQSATGAVKTIVDGAGNAISHVVPTGGLVGLGALASSLGAARAIPGQADLQTLSSNVLSQSFQSLMSVMSAAMVTAAVGTTNPTEFAVAFEVIVTAANWIVNNVTPPTIPNCSSLVRVAP